MNRLPIHIEVKDHPDTKRAKALIPESTDVFVSGNGYQWSGFTLAHKADLVALRDAINVRLDELDGVDTLRE